MSVYKDTKNNTWKVYYRFTDWQGKVHQSTKRGFPTKREALAWEREQLHKVEADLDMTFESFIDTYTADMKNRLKENTWHTKEHIIRTKLLPYFAKRKMNSIQPKDIIAWQNEMIKCRDIYFSYHFHLLFWAVQLSVNSLRSTAAINGSVKNAFIVFSTVP